LEQPDKTCHSSHAVVSEARPQRPALTAETDPAVRAPAVCSTAKPGIVSTSDNSKE